MSLLSSPSLRLCPSYHLYPNTAYCPEPRFYLSFTVLVLIGRLLFSWSLGPSFCAGTPFESVSEVYINAWPRILRAINTAAKYDIGVLVDLHGAPGSQNGARSITFFFKLTDPKGKPTRACRTANKACLIIPPMFNLQWTS